MTDIITISKWKKFKGNIKQKVSEQLFYYLFLKKSYRVSPLNDIFHILVSQYPYISRTVTSQILIIMIYISSKITKFKSDWKAFTSHPIFRDVSLVKIKLKAWAYHLPKIGRKISALLATRSWLVIFYFCFFDLFFSFSCLFLMYV